MGKAFFTGWELWHKMTFVLGCGIVATLMLGICKLQYDKYKLRKYTKVEKGKKALTPEMLEAQPVEPLAQQVTKDDIPFGIRAIESGIEVDGVWISRSNTPVGSSASSIRTETRLPLSLNNSQLELPQAIHGSSRGSSRTSSPFELAVNAERIPTTDSRSSSPGNLLDTHGRPPVATNSRAGNPNVPRNPMAMHASEGYQQPSSSTARPELGPLSHSGSRSSIESDYMNSQEGRPYEPAYINPRPTASIPRAVSVDPRMDLNLLQSHRLSHVAETGQLTPRVRRLGNSGDWASATENQRLPQEVSTANGVDFFVPRQKTPSPPLRPIAIPTEDAAIPSSSKLNQDGHASHQSGQAKPLLETYAPDAQKTYQPEAYQPRGPHYDYEDRFAPQDVVTHHQQHESQVLRKVNSGFEILRPGTFGQPSSPEEEQPVDNVNSFGDKRQSKRLQKRRKSSSGSQTRTSHFIEQV